MRSKDIIKNTEMSRTDKLAMERTRLANERTFLAYFRTFIVFMSSGIAILKIPSLEDITFIGYFLLIVSPVLLVIGISRFFYVKRQLGKYY
jgi:putative membrane protein